MKPIIYTTPTCTFCHALMDWMDQKNIAYEEKDCTKPEVEKEIMDKLGHEVEVVPTTVIGDEIIEGFNRPAIKKALKKYEKEK